LKVLEHNGEVDLEEVITQDHLGRFEVRSVVLMTEQQL
jgi:hypothetical protein